MGTQIQGGIEIETEKKKLDSEHICVIFVTSFVSCVKILTTDEYSKPIQSVESQVYYIS
jgi:hypothetical protein